MASGAWWQTLYEQRFTHGWREPAGLTDRQVTFLVNALDLTPADEVLDVACGYGRHALGLLERGHRVVGLDYGRRRRPRPKAAGWGGAFCLG